MGTTSKYYWIVIFLEFASFTAEELRIALIIRAYNSCLCVFYYNDRISADLPLCTSVHYLALTLLSLIVELKSLSHVRILCASTNGCTAFGIIIYVEE